MEDNYKPIDEQSTFKKISLEDMSKEITEKYIAEETPSVIEPTVSAVPTLMQRYMLLDKAYAEAERNVIRFIVDYVKEKTNNGDNVLKFNKVLWYGAGRRAAYVAYNKNNDSVYVMLGNGIITYITEHGHFDNRTLALAMLEEKYELKPNERNPK